MRFFAPVFATLAAIAAAQSACNVNCILVPNTGLQVKAGQSFTITWSNPSAGQITIKLQNGNDITPNTGITLATNVDASSGRYTVQIPSNVVLSNQYTFETIDQSNTNNINFSPPFAIQGATAVSTASAASSTSASRSSSSGSMTATSSGTMTSNSSMSTVTGTSTGTSSRTSSATSTATTAAPNSATGGASSLKIDGALIALIAVGLAAF